MDVEAKKHERDVGCGPHCLELTYTEIRDGKVKTVLGCSACGKTEEYSVALNMYQRGTNLRRSE